MHLDGLSEFEKDIHKKLSALPDRINRFAAREAEAALGFIRKETPVNNGTLQAGWQRTQAQDGVVDIYNNTDYAAHVEYGYRRRAHWVPGIWRGDRFYYDPKAKTGMMVKPKLVKGQKMLHKGILTYKKTFAQRAKKQIEKLLGED